MQCCCPLGRVSEAAHLIVEQNGLWGSHAADKKIISHPKYKKKIIRGDLNLLNITFKERYIYPLVKTKL